MPIFHPYTGDYGINLGLETSIIPWGESGEPDYNDYKEQFVCGTLKEVRFAFNPGP
jgi:hypothetical protein